MGQSTTLSNVHNVFVAAAGKSVHVKNVSIRIAQCHWDWTIPAHEEFSKPTISSVSETLLLDENRFWKDTKIKSTFDVWAVLTHTSPPNNQLLSHQSRIAFWISSIHQLIKKKCLFVANFGWKPVFFFGPVFRLSSLFVHIGLFFIIQVYILFPSSGWVKNCTHFSSRDFPFISVIFIT